MSFFLLALIFINSLFQGIHNKLIVEMNNICKSKISIEDTNEFLLETFRGKIPLKPEYKQLNECDIDLIQKINKNIPCLYLLIDNNDSYNKTIGLYLGAGINLFNYNYEELRLLFRKERMGLNYIKLINNIEQDKNINISFLDKYETPFNNIDKFNRVMINYTISQFMNKVNNYQKYNTFFLNSVLSLYIQQIITDKEFQDFLNMNPSLNEVAYIIEYLWEIFPNTRLIQSKLINLFEANFKYNYNHIFFVIEKNIFQQDELNNIIQLIQNLYNKLINTINNNNRISILINSNNNYTYIINYQKDRDNLYDLLKSENKSEITLNLTNIYTTLNKQFEENKKEIFENKLLILFLNYETNLPLNKNELIEQYKNQYNIQTIPIVNIANTFNYSKDILNYNIFNNFTEVISIQNILFAINNMHVPIYLNNTNKTKLTNIKINDIDNPLFFEVNINEETKKENEYYEIALEIKETHGYNIFISNSNPYPSVRNNLNSFLKYKNNMNPKIRIKSKDIKKKGFYIGVWGRLQFNIFLEKKNYEGNIDNLILSEGEYDYINYNISLDNKNTKFTFGENYTIKSNIFKNETKEDLMKYFTRGIDLDNTEDYSFLNYNLFIFLYGDKLVNRIYKDNNGNYYFGYNLNLKEYTPLKLKQQAFDQFMINKLYPFLNIFNDLNDKAPSITFDDFEIKQILYITFISYEQELSNRISRYPSCILFKEQTPTLKFILFCLYFSYHDDTSIIRAIINLSLKKPEYSTTINLLKEKMEDNTFLMNLIKQLEQEDKTEKIMTSIIMGKSLLLSNIGLNFTNEYYNIMSKSMTKIAISFYDTINQKIKNIIPFPSTNNNPKVEEIFNLHKEGKNKFNSTQKMNLKIINDFAYAQFKHYDRGIKKKIIVICDENLEEENYIINNELEIPNDLNEINNDNLINNQIDLILITTKNFEQGPTPYLFQLKNKNNIYSIYENYFHVSNLKETEIYMQDLNRLIKGSSIKLKLGQRLINDYYQNKNSYFSIDCSEYPDDVIVIKTNISNFNFYASLRNPFPYYSDNNLIETKKGAVVITKCKDGFAYFGLESKYDIRKEIIEIFSCESYQPDKNCKSVANNKKEWIILGIIVLVFVILFVLYKCKYNMSTKSNKKNKKRLNIFDAIK